MDDHKDKVAVGFDDHDHVQDVAVKLENEKDPGKITPQLSIDENKQATRLSLDTTEKMHHQAIISVILTVVTSAQYLPHLGTEVTLGFSFCYVKSMIMLNALCICEFR